MAAGNLGGSTTGRAELCWGDDPLAMDGACDGGTALGPRRVSAPNDRRRSPRLASAREPSDLLFLVWFDRELVVLRGRAPTVRSFHGGCFRGTDEPTQFQAP